MLTDGYWIAAAAGAAAFSFALVADHYRRRSAALEDKLRAKEAKAAVFAEGHARYRLLIEKAPMACIVWEPGFRISEWNAQAEAIFGWSATEMVGRSLLSSLVPLHVRSRMMEDAIALFADGQPRHVVLPGLTRSGKVVTCEWHHAIARDESGAPARVVSLCMNVTATEQLKRENAELQLKAALAAREREFRTLTENTPDTIGRYDRDCRCVYANPALLNGLGQEEASLLGHTPAETLPDPEQGRAFEEAMRGTVASGEGGEFMLTWQDNRRGTVWNHVRLVPELDRHGEIVSVLAIGRDVTERKLMETSLRASEARWQFALTGSGQGVWDWHVPSGEVHYSALYRSMLGYDECEFSGRVEEWETRVHPADVAAAMESHRAHFEGETSYYSAEFRMRCKDGTWKWIHSRGMTVERDADGGALRIIGTHTDISARKQAEAELRRHADFQQTLLATLRQREQDFRALAENSPDVIVRCDAEGRRVYINAAHAAAFHKPAASLLGKTNLEARAVPLREARKLHELVTGVAASGQAAALELAWRRHDGSRAAYHVRAVPEVDESGRVATVLTVARDIAAMKDTERRLIESRALLHELTARRESEREAERKRVANELHEGLAQVLSALRMEVSTLPMKYGDGDPELAERARAMLALIDQSVKSMRNVVAELRPTTLDAGIAAAFEWLGRDFSQSTGVACGVHLPAEPIHLPEPQATAVFRIVEEALKNVAHHARATRADIVLARDKTQWRLTVRDNGRGLGRDRSTQRDLGLLGMRQRAQVLGGELRVSSAGRSGTTVRLRFPIEP